MNLRIVLTLTLLAAAGCGRDEPAAPAAPSADPSPPAAAVPAQSAPLPERAAEQSTRPRIELAQADEADDATAAAGYEEGVHYERLSPTQPTSSSPEQVEVAEFFMYSCIHCYNFEPYVQAWLETKPEYVNFVRVPTVWNPLVKLHGQAFYAAEALGKGDEMHTPFFREMHVSGNLLQSEEALAEFFGRFGVDAEAFEGAFDSFAVHTKVQRADELTRRYRINGTPSVVVNGKYVTTASMAGGYEELMDLIDALAQSERGTR